MKTAYTGPVKDRGVTADGKAKVSREELADFKRKYGADKTLRDLLNADRTGRTPAPVSSDARVGPTVARGTALRKEREAREAVAQEPLERLKRLPALESNEAARDRYRENTLNALVGLGTVAGAPVAAGLGRALGSMARSPRAARATEALVREVDDIPAFKRGGKVKSYAKGGSVRGAGCESRGKKTRFV